MFARELNRDAGLSYFFNSKDYKNAGHDLINRDMFGRIPEDAYKNGTIQRQVAGFDDAALPENADLGRVYRHRTDSFRCAVQTEAWHLDADGNKENVDNRIAVVKLSAGTGLSVATRFHSQGEIPVADG